MWNRKFRDVAVATKLAPQYRQPSFYKTGHTIFRFKLSERGPEGDFIAGVKAQCKPELKADIGSFCTSNYGLMGEAAICPKAKDAARVLKTSKQPRLVRNVISKVKLRNIGPRLVLQAMSVSQMGKIIIVPYLHGARNICWGETGKKFGR